MKFSFIFKKNRESKLKKNYCKNLFELNHMTRLNFDGRIFKFYKKENPEKVKTCLSGYFKNIKGLYRS